MSEDAQIDERVERTDVGVSIELELKRGSGTRDQDKLKAKVKAHDLASARDDVEALKPDLREWAAHLRTIQPEEADD